MNFVYIYLLLIDLLQRQGSSIVVVVVDGLVLEDQVSTGWSEHPQGRRRLSLQLQAR